MGGRGASLGTSAKDRFNYGGGSVTLSQLEHASLNFKLKFYGFDSLDDIKNEFGFYSRGDQEKLLDQLFEDDVLAWVNTIREEERLRDIGAGAYDPNRESFARRQLQKILLDDDTLHA